ncbi:serine protease [Bradyrhizobium sp. Ash2021]|uniref:S1 family peptidase n=1 Tax=Bradyrhizobium sp. Ash2021 TaxID=2954771 RepID=UPI0028159D05|nr:serine protease [Bradyrhizobium sp. Ash2021]WMT76279.1 serine protease [Bradyrhizobium sp. Ash2021]
MQNADKVIADGRLATFAILGRPTLDSFALIGTGFYLQGMGGFATAAHVALEAERHLAEMPDSVGIARTLPNGRTHFLPIWKFFVHPTADVAFGIPRYEFVDDASGNVIRPKVHSLSSQPPPIGTPISTWAYPLHAVVDADEGRVFRLQPDFYDGLLEERFEDRGPSVKLTPPYFRTSINLHGGSSGGPVFDADGKVFGIASCGYDGATDIAFVTPAGSLLDLEIAAYLRLLRGRTNDNPAASRRARSDRDGCALGLLFEGERRRCLKRTSRS